MAIVFKKSLCFSIKEIECSESNWVLGIQIQDTKGCVMFVFGVYLPSDNDIEAFMHELSIVDSLYNYYSDYGKVIIAGDMNSSIIDLCNTNARKSKLLLNFVQRYNLSIPNRDFLVEGENFTFVQKLTTLDYIFFDKCVLKKSTKL